MTSTFTNSLRLDKQGLGDRVNTWGTTGLNQGVIDLVDSAIAGSQTINVSSATHILTTANASSDQARAAILVFTGNPGALLQVTAPSVSKTYIIHNRLSGGYGLSIATSGGVGVTVNNGSVSTVYTDSTDFYVANGATATASGALFVATSDTSLAIGTGAKAFTLNETDRAFGIGTRLLAADASSPGTNYMQGYVSAYSGTALTLQVDTVTGSGTIADWVLVVDGSVTALLPPTATEPEAEAGTSNDAYMTPLRTAQAIAALGIPTVGYRAVSANDDIEVADQAKIIDASGTITLTFASAATLGAGWFAYVANNGAGDITVQGNATELDGLASYIMYPGEARLFQCDGTAIRSTVLRGFYKAFTAAGTFVKPPGYSFFEGLLWGGGGGGGWDGTTSGGGGGGGACVPLKVPAAIVGTSETITIGAGGTGRTGSSGVGTAGGNSSFGSLVTAYGGGGGGAGGAGGGGGGGALTAGLTGSGGDGPGGEPGRDTATAGFQNHGYGGSNGADASANTQGGSSAYGGAGGGAPHTSSADARKGGRALYGGGGGAGASSGSLGAADGQSSVFGGSGGRGAAGTAPAGGGSAGNTGAGGRDGARGEARIWGVV